MAIGSISASRFRKSISRARTEDFPEIPGKTLLTKANKSVSLCRFERLRRSLVGSRAWSLLLKKETGGRSLDRGAGLVIFGSRAWGYGPRKVDFGSGG
jgi:hypothetical protein